MTSSDKNRSVNDYENEDDLRRALMGMGNETATAEGSPASGGTDSVTVATAENSKATNLDWVLSNFDPESSQVQSMEEEVKRLQALKILDTEREQASRGPSLNDYESEDALRQALMMNDAARAEALLAQEDKNTDEGDFADTNQAEDMDWVLTNYDTETTEIQTMDDEVKRLQILKNYLILDSDREEVFEKITSNAALMFNVPIVLISLVDLGRQWFMSNHGLGNTRETPRRYSFCAHVILNTKNIIVVTDATKDVRFMDNALVTGPPYIRFYAGASLISPEGYKLGTFCVISDQPRPEGLTEEQKQTLTDLADMTVKAMVERRRELERQEMQRQGADVGVVS